MGRPYHYKGKVFFGYMNEQGAIIECEVKNLPESVKDWKAELMYDQATSKAPTFPLMTNCH